MSIDPVLERAVLAEMTFRRPARPAPDACARHGQEVIMAETMNSLEHLRHVARAVPPRFVAGFRLACTTPGSGGCTSREIWRASG